MKRQLIVAAIIAATFTACKTTPKGDEATTTDTQTVATTSGNDYTVDSASTVGFTGNGVGKNHPGTFKVSEGKISAADGKVTAGTFTININSIVLTEPAEMIQTKLKGHLLSPDFFDAAKFTTAKFEITKVTEYTSNGTDKSVVAGANALVSGNLTLKDSTKNVSFPANISVSETEVTAKANFNIDRTEWGMSYGNDKSLKDKFISPEVNIAIDIKAKK
ncbi:MAG: YceI family protein [Chitinophagales bacterium]